MLKLRRMTIYDEIKTVCLLVITSISCERRVESLTSGTQRIPKISKNWQKQWILIKVRCSPHTFSLSVQDTLQKIKQNPVTKKKIENVAHKLKSSKYKEHVFKYGIRLKQFLHTKIDLLISPRQFADEKKYYIQNKTLANKKLRNILFSNLSHYNRGILTVCLHFSFIDQFCESRFLFLLQINCA